MGRQLFNQLARQMTNLRSQDIVDSDGIGVISRV